MKTCALLSALVLASASEDIFTEDGLSLLQLRATTQGNLDDHQSPCLCSIVVDTSTVTNAQTGGGGLGQWLVDGVWTTKQQFRMASGSKTISSGAQVTTPGEVLPGATPTAIKLTAGSSDGWGYKKISVECGGQVLVLLDSPNGAEYAGGATPEYWVDLPSSVHSSKEYALTGALAAQVTSCSPPTTTPLPTEAPDVLNYPVGDGYGQVTSEEGCRDLATKWGMELGGGGFKFSGGYSNKGCYTYKSGAFACKAFYGKGGDEARQLRNFLADSSLIRLGSDAQAQCAPTWTPPADEASATGDPHLITNTGTHYDYISPAQQDPCLCSIIVDTSTQADAESSQGGMGQFMVDGDVTPSKWSKEAEMRAAGSKVLSAGQPATNLAVQLTGRPTSVRLMTASSKDGWGFKKVSINCGGQVLVLLDSENGAPHVGPWFGTGSTPQEYWTVGRENKDIAIEGDAAAQLQCGAPATTAAPRVPCATKSWTPPKCAENGCKWDPVNGLGMGDWCVAVPADDASAIGDPHITNNVGKHLDYTSQ